MKTSDKTICDRCENYEVSPSGCTEKCKALRIVNGNSPIRFLTENYVNERMNGNKTTCKEYSKL